MGLEFITRIIVSSFLLSALAALVLAAFGVHGYPGGVLLGTAWGCANLYIIKRLILEATAPRAGQGPSNLFNLLLILCVKFPLLYFAGYLLLRLELFPVVALVAGFTLVFFVALLKALGRMIADRLEVDNTVKQCGGKAL